jgi:hypothetical protein
MGGIAPIDFSRLPSRPSWLSGSPVKKGRAVFRSPRQMIPNDVRQLFRDGETDYRPPDIIWVCDTIKFFPDFLSGKLA